MYHPLPVSMIKAVSGTGKQIPMDKPFDRSNLLSSIAVSAETHYLFHKTHPIALSWNDDETVLVRTLNFYSSVIASP